MKTAIPRVLVIGSAYVEVTLGVPRLPAGGETISEATLSVACGGRGLNQAVAARRLGAEVRFVGSAGIDRHGDQIADTLHAEGIPISCVPGPGGGQDGSGRCLQWRPGRWPGGRRHVGTGAAALTCTRRGGHASFPLRAEVEAFFRSLKR